MKNTGKIGAGLVTLLALATFVLGFSQLCYGQSYVTPISGSQIQVVWQEYESNIAIYRSGTQIYLGNGSASSMVDGGLSQGTTYSYCIQAGRIGEDFNWIPTSDCNSIGSATTFSAPSAPSSLGASAASGTQINISWADNSGNETGFVIERKTGAGGSYGYLTTVGANATSYGDSGLSNGTTYYYRVYATNSVGNSGYSNEAGATTLAPPSAPSSLGASAVSGTQINLSWTDASGNETGFLIERKTGAGGAYSQIASVSANVVSYSNSGLTSGTAYYYRIRATNSAGNSGYSNEANATTLSAPAAPSGLGAGSVSATQVNLTWTDNSGNETGFKIERKAGANGTYAQIATPAANSTSFNDTGLTTGTTYYYQVRATNSVGDSAYSNVASATPSPPPSITLRGATSNAASSGTTFTLSTPTGTAANDVMIAAIAFRPYNITITAPSGWTLVQRIDNFDAASSSMAVYRRVATGTEPSSHQWTFSIGITAVAGGIQGFVGVDTANPLNVSSGTTTIANLSHATNSITTTVGDTLLVTAHAMPSSVTWNSPTGMTKAYERANLTIPNQSGESIVGSYGGQYVAGSTGQKIATASAFPDSGITYILALNPLPSLPAAPSSLSATVASATQINLSWADNSGNETGFKLERKLGANGTYAQIATPAADAVSYNNTGLTTGATYYYRIRATNSAGDSAYSNEVHATAFPSQPGDVTGSQTLTFEYDPFGNLTKTTDGAGNQTVLTYDLRGRKTAMADPDMGSWSYAYDSAGQLIRQTDAKTNVSTMTYDALGRMTARNEGDLTSSWTYDSCTKGVGKLCSVSASNGYARSYTYDSLGRPSSLGMTIDTSYTTTTTYDSSGRVSGVTYPTGQFAVTYVYNTTGYLSEVRKASDNSLLWQATQLTASGQVLSETLGNSLVTTRGFDSMDRLTSIQSGSGVGTVHQHGYTYDSIGNLTQRVDQVQSVTENFAYDALNRLTMVSGSSITTRTFSYDAIGNITYKSDVGAYTYPASGTSSVRPHAVSGVSGFINSSYTYDANGNLTAGNGRTLTYASFNLPTTVSATGYSYTYTYSAEHERVRLVTVRPDDTLTSIYIHPNGGGSLLYEKETKQSTGEVENKFYVSAGKELVGVFVINNTVSVMRYYHKDHLGSVAVITNPVGTVIERLAYEAFGERRYPNGTPEDRASPIIGINTDRGFTAHEHLDELNLIHMNGRIYDPALARFMTPDPFVDSKENAQSYNRFSYVANNPLAFSDPSGYFKLFGIQITPRLIAAAVVTYLTYGATTDLMAGYTASAGGTSVFGVSTVTAANQLGVSGLGASLAAGGASGFAGALVANGGDVRSAFQGALSGAVFAGVAYGFNDQWTWGRVVANTLAGGALSELSGGSIEQGARSQFLYSTLRLGWQSTMDLTNSGKIRSIEYLQNIGEGDKVSGADCGYGIGPCSGGSREAIVNGEVHFQKIDPSSGTYQNAPIPSATGFANYGMPREGTWLDGKWFSPIVKPIFEYTSKLHDFGNSWRYNSDGIFVPFASGLGNDLLNLYSMSTMVPAAFATGAAYVPPSLTVDKARRR